MTNGHCLCGAVKFSYDAEPKWTLNCHCESCRRATSTAMTTWLSVPRSALRFTAAIPEYYASSTGDRKSTRLNSSHSQISYAVFCLKKKHKRTAHHITYSSLPQ